MSGGTVDQVYPGFDPYREPSVTVRLGSLRAADSPRLAGESPGHVEALAASEAPLPPIVVSRLSMRVIDGMHRLRAAALRGDETIEVVFFDGGDEDAFALAVRTNIAHGLPLSVADRKAAARRIVVTHPHLSDRSIADLAGLSGKTVGAIRRATTREVPQPGAKLGRDGKVRPVDAVAGRRRAHDLIVSNPGASLRAIARQAGVAPGTVRAVRERMRRGEDPIRSTVASHQRVRLSAAVTRAPLAEVRPIDADSTLRSLRTDPSLRFTEAGRSLLRWLDTHFALREQRMELIDSVPPHCSRRVAELARLYAAALREFAEQVSTREQDLAVAAE